MSTNDWTMWPPTAITINIKRCWSCLIRSVSDSGILHTRGTDLHHVQTPRCVSESIIQLCSFHERDSLNQSLQSDSVLNSVLRLWSSCILPVNTIKANIVVLRQLAVAQYKKSLTSSDINIQLWETNNYICMDEKKPSRNAQAYHACTCLCSISTLLSEL